MKPLFIFIFFFTCFESIGQNIKISSDPSNYIITGKVYDSTLKQNLSGVSIICRNKFGTTTGYDGSFLLKLPNSYIKKNFAILVLCIGYKPAKIKVRNKKTPLTKIINVYLKKSNVDLSEFYITQ